MAIIVRYDLSHYPLMGEAETCARFEKAFPKNVYVPLDLREKINAPILEHRIVGPKVTISGSFSFPFFLDFGKGITRLFQGPMETWFFYRPSVFPLPEDGGMPLVLEKLLEKTSYTHQAHGLLKVDSNVPLLGEGYRTVA